MKESALARGFYPVVALGPEFGGGFKGGGKSDSKGTSKGKGKRGKDMAKEAPFHVVLCKA